MRLISTHALAALEQLERDLASKGFACRLVGRALVWSAQCRRFPVVFPLVCGCWRLAWYASMSSLARQMAGHICYAPATLGAPPGPPPVQVWNKKYGCQLNTH